MFLIFTKREKKVYMPILSFEQILMKKINCKADSS